MPSIAQEGADVAAVMAEIGGRVSATMSMPAIAQEARRGLLANRHHGGLDTMQGHGGSKLNPKTKA